MVLDGPSKYRVEGLTTWLRMRWVMLFANSDRTPAKSSGKTARRSGRWISCCRLSNAPHPRRFSVSESDRRVDLNVNPRLRVELDLCLRGRRFQEELKADG